jgi:Ca-activated chloride channel family protein
MNIVLTPLKRAISESADESFHVLLRVQAPATGAEQPIPLRIAVVVDRSGSMQGAPLREAKRCVRYLVEHLSAADHVALVVYDDTVQTPIEMMAADLVQPVVGDTLSTIDPGGSTDLHAGWLTGADLVAPHTAGDALCRVILLSDGKANEGLTDVHQITRQVRALAQTGVTTTTVGLGRSFNEHLMSSMAEAGQGMAHYGERSEDLFETFESELGLMKNLVWRNVRVTLRGIDGARVINRYAREAEAWCLPSITGGAEAWAVIRIPATEVRQLTEAGSGLTVIVSAVDRNGEPHQITETLRNMSVVPASTYAALPRDELVARRLLELEAAEIQSQARDAASRGDWAQVERLIDDLEELAVDHPWIGASLRHLRWLLEHRDRELMSKELHYKSMSMNSRLSSLDESIFDASMEATTPSYLRRKESQGRRTQR